MRWKRALLIAAVVAVVLIAAAWVVIATYDYNRLKPQIANAFKEATGRDLSLRGDLTLKIGLSPTLVVNSAAVQNAAWGSRPEMAEIKRFEVRLALFPLLFRRIDVKRIVLASPDILIETNPVGKSNLDFLTKMSAESSKKEKAAPGKVRLTVNEMRIEDARLTYKNGKTGKTYAVTLARFEASAGSADSPLRVWVNGSYNGNAIEAEGKLIPLAGLTNATTPWPFDLNVQVAGASINLNGTIKDVADFQGLEVKVALRSKDIGRLGALGAPLPIEGPFSLSCRLADTGPEAYEVTNLQLAAAGSDLAGSVALDLSKSRPVMRADLQSRRIDLRPPAGKTKEKTRHETKSAEAKIFPTSPLPLGPLQLADVNMHFKAGEVLTPQVALHELDLTLALKGGNLSVNPLAAVVGGGRVDGRFSLEPRGKGAHIATAITFRQIDVGAMLRELKKSEIIDGRLDGRIDVNGTGGSVAGIVSGLGGITYATMGEGKINNKYLGVLGSDIASNILRMVNPFKKESPFTHVSCMVCGFKIGNGKAETTALVVNSDDMSVVGNGTIDLRTEGLDFSLDPVPKGGIGTGITGKLNLSLGELTRPFKLAGTLSQPSLALDFKQAALAAGKAVGGLMLFGPVGLGGALLGSGSDDKQLCPLAIKAAQQGVKLNMAKKGVVGKTTQGVENGISALGKGLKGLFGK